MKYNNVGRDYISSRPRSAAGRRNLVGALPCLGLILGLALTLMLAGCNEKETQSQPAEPTASSAVPAPSASAEAVPVPADMAEPAEDPSESKAAQARREARDAAGDAAEAIKEAAGLTLDDAKAVVGEKAQAAKEGARDFGEKADAAIEKAGVAAGSALKDAAEKTDSAIQKAAQKADGKLSDLASKATGALGLDEEAKPEEGGSSAGLTEKFLINQKFSLKKINEADFTDSAALGTPQIEFGQGFMVSGKVCNNFRGPGQLADGKLKVPAMASTRMACADEVFGQLEQRLFSMLESGADISMNGSFLILKQGETTLIFEAETGLK